MLESSMMRPVYLNRSHEIVISHSQTCSSRSSSGFCVRNKPSIKAPAVIEASSAHRFLTNTILLRGTSP